MITCARCGEEVRSGYRNGVQSWWHREDVDHVAILGQPYTEEMRARWLDQYRNHQWPLEDGTMTTTAEWEARRRKKKASDDDAFVIDESLPDPDIICHPIEIDDLPARSGMRQIANLLVKSGWELRRLTHSKGPYVGSKGTVLSISDSIVIGAVGPEVDNGRKMAVGFWRDAKFDFAIVGLIKDGATRDTQLVSTTELKEWIKA